MNKAFTKESDGDDNDRPGEEGPVLPAGSKNYITAAGFSTLQRELAQLMDVDRPKVVEAVHWAAKNGDRSENGDYIYGKKRLREIDRRVRFLTKRMEAMEIVDPSAHHGSDQVFFGACVGYVDDSGHKRTVTILGIDEADSSRGEVSWVSPVARALLKAREGNTVRLVAPGGTQDIEILVVSYPAAPDR